MKYHRLNELLELLQPAWQQEPDLNLLAFLQKLAQESGFSGPLSELSDDVLIYHLKMRDADSQAVIPSLKKDYEVDFKSALLRARSVINDDE
ncbi:MAG: DUF1040 family protein [Pantoea sp. Pent]|nr:DUF1040 family protein [Pantoea sp. Pent]